jgi:hypothetical protein
MRLVILLLVVGPTLGCESSAVLMDRSSAHLANARQAYYRGDREEAAKEQKRALRDYDRAAIQAYKEERPIPPPPEPAVFPEREKL